MIAQVHEENLALDKEGEERGANEGKSVAARLTEEQKSEEGEIVGDPTSKELSKDAKKATSRNKGLKIITPTTKINLGTPDIPDATKSVIAVPPSALVTARTIEDLRLITYPEGFTGPKQELNVNSMKGKFIYDREFLLQFMGVCTEKPDVPLDMVGLDAVGGQPHRPVPRSSGRNHTLTQPMSLQAPKSGLQPGTPGGFATVNFSLTSKERVMVVQPSTSYTIIGPGGKRTRSKRGKERNQLNDVHALNVEPVPPLVASANKWTKQPLADEGQNIERKVKALLNKLTMAKFDTLSDQIIEWVNKSEAENDGRTLILVTRLVFESATRTTWPEVYALLCRKIVEGISPNVQDGGIRDASGKPITGGQLFRKFLLNHCERDFERSWVAMGSEDTPVKKSETSDEVELYSDEYGAARITRRRALGLVQFVSELYKLRMLTERVMHEYINRFLANIRNNPGEMQIEGLCRLLTTAGKLLDGPKGRAHINVYFARMEQLRKSSNVAPRMQFMLQDVIELRERKWIPRNQVTATTQIDRWSVAGGSTPRPPPKAGDLSNFGKIAKSGPVVMGSSIVWAGKKDGAKRDDILARVNSTSNMFTMLGRDVDETNYKPIRPSDGVTSVSLGVGGIPEPHHRKAKHLPRQEPVEVERGVNDAPPAMSKAGANKKMAEDIEEFFIIRDIDKWEDYFVKLPPGHRHRLVEEMVSMAVVSGEADGKLVADAFARAVEKNLCSISAFEEGFLPVAELLDYIVVDNLKAIRIMATVMKGAGLDKDEDRRTRIAQKSVDCDKLLELLA